MKLSNRTKVLEQEELTLAERIYLPAIAGGMMTTLKHFFQKPVTIRYPEQKRYLGPVFRGHHILKRDQNGAERCTACGLCAVACPAEAISMVAEERKKGEETLYREEKYAKVYESICYVVFSVDFAKKLALRKLFSYAMTKWYLFSTIETK